MYFTANSYIAALLKFISIPLAALVITACGPSEKYPEVYGLYAWNGTAWIPVGKAKATIELDLPGETKFLIHYKAINEVSESFRLVRKVYIRNLISQYPDGTGRVVKPYKMWAVKSSASDEGWVVQGFGEIDGRFSPVKNHPEMVTWAPSEKLSAGVYVPAIKGDHQETVTVVGQAVLPNIEGSNFCYDRIFSLARGVGTKYTPCAEIDKNEQELPAALSELDALISQHGLSLPESGRGVLKRIVDSGGNPNLRVRFQSLLSIAAQSEFIDLIELLLARGADINGRGDDGTPLYWAVAAGKVSVALLLVKKGANVNLPRSDGLTPIDVIAYLDKSDPRVKELVTALREKGAKPKE
ncbi:MAG: ankyrin repeat domain-containing protein [Sulfuritalea sp.]|nr:ankyrin repeat domain-containing protein [Sulfuritalea sp.]MDP1982114.1 ankyrin repeat domain-containing protein [Sulfuritalea sp.]